MPPNEAETRACQIDPRLEAAGWGGDRNSTRFRPIAIRHRLPLLLYVQRRMGKISLLNNLGRLLPSAIIPLFVDLQGPASRASDHAAFPYSVARGISNTAARQRDQRADSAQGLPEGGRSASTHRATGQGLFLLYEPNASQVEAAGLALLRFLAAQGEGSVISRGRWP